MYLFLILLFFSKMVKLHKIYSKKKKIIYLKKKILNYEKYFFKGGEMIFFVESPQGVEKNTALAKQAKNVFKKIILKNPSERLFENTNTKLCWLEFEF